MTERREGYITLDARLEAIENKIEWLTRLGGKHSRLIWMAMGGLAIIGAEIPIGLWVLTQLINR